MSLAKFKDKFYRDLYRAVRKTLPPISATEQIALECGTTGSIDDDLFANRPSLQRYLDRYRPKRFTPIESKFLNDQVPTLCGMVNNHDVMDQTKDFTKETWDYLRDQGFLTLQLPREHGGKYGFSTNAIAAVLQKLGSHSYDLNGTVAVPNSVGPSEMLVKYGTDAQREYYLPLLASGTYIPCFALTGPHAGSDATSLTGSDGVVQRHPKTGELGIVATFDKRYITLAPVAGVTGIGLNVTDPDNLLQGVGQEGFTVALLERSHPGLEMGPRHMPLNAALMNGTIQGKDVWIPIDTHVLGGQERCGNGWHMFVECLAEGRGVSLPAGSVATGRVVVTAVGAYARIRKQFRTPIAEFGGIQEALALAGSDALITIAGTDLMNAIIDNHEAPMVLSSIMKQNCTARGRSMAERGMDIAAGAGICRGDKNIMASVYMGAPIGITVEGANIMTRSFQIVGQGLTRCHPYMLGLLHSLQMPEDKEEEGLEMFRDHVGRIVRHTMDTFLSSVTQSITSSIALFFRKDTAHLSDSGSPLLDHHEKQLKRLTANFAFTANLCLTLGGQLKFEELLMGRLADAMGAIYLGYAVLHHYSRNRLLVEGLEPLVEHAMLRLEFEAQEALLESSQNFPGRHGAIVGWIMRFACSPLGGFSQSYLRSPPDHVTKEVSRLLTTPNPVRDLFQENVYMTQEGDANPNQISRLVAALPICVEADQIAAQLRKSKKSPSTREQSILDQAEALRNELIQVDVFAGLVPAELQSNYTRPALQGTEERLARDDRMSFLYN